MSKKPAVSQKQRSRFCEWLVVSTFLVCVHYSIVATEAQRAEVALWSTLGDAIEESAFGGVLTQWIKLCSPGREGKDTQT